MGVTKGGLSEFRRSAFIWADVSEMGVDGIIAAACGVAEVVRRGWRRGLFRGLEIGGVGVDLCRRVEARSCMFG